MPSITARTFRCHTDFVAKSAPIQKGLIGAKPLIARTMSLARAGEAFNTAAGGLRAMQDRIAFGQAKGNRCHSMRQSIRASAPL